MREQNLTSELRETEYLPGALGEFMTPKEKSQLSQGNLGRELIELAVRRS